mgnify:CR=1 FL=1
MHDCWWFEVISSEHEIQNVQSMKCNYETMKKRLAALTCYSILAITWATHIGLRWFLNNFEAKT